MYLYGYAVRTTLPYTVYIGVGLCVVRSASTGNARAPEFGTDACVVLTLFYVYLVNSFFMHLFGLQGTRSLGKAEPEYCDT